MDAPLRTGSLTVAAQYEAGPVYRVVLKTLSCRYAAVARSYFFRSVTVMSRR